MTHSPDINTVIANLERQIDELRRQTSDVSAALADRTEDGLEDLRHRARHAYDGASHGMRRAAHYARHEGSHVADVVKENPVTASTVTVAAAGLIGLGIWWLLSSDR